MEVIWDGGGPVAWTPDSPDSIGFTVYDFWKKADPIYADPSSDIWNPNFDAQYKIINDGSETITFQRLALAIHDANNNFLWDMANPDTGEPRYYDNVFLDPGTYHYFNFSVSYFQNPGNYKVVAKAQINGQWSELASMDFQVLNASTLSYISISGSTDVNESSGAQYTCTAYYSDGSSSTVTSSASWSENCSYATISSSGYLTTSSVSSDQSCTITATYGGNSDTHDVTIKDNPTITVTSPNGGESWQQGAQHNIT